MATSLSVFENLPTEVIQKIAVHCYKDVDVYSLIRTSSRFCHALNGAESHVWRERFLKLYDCPAWYYGQHSMSLTKQAYQHRSRVFRRAAIFCHVPNPSESSIAQGTEWLNVVRTLLLEAYDSPRPGKSNNLTISKNFEVLRDVFKAFKFFDRCTYRWKRTSIGQSGLLYDAVQLLLTPFALEIGSDLNVLSHGGREDYEITAIYAQSMPTPFKGQEVCPYLVGDDLLFGEVASHMNDHDSLHLFRILEIRNFWKRHLCYQAEHTYWSVNQHLPRPQMFDAPLTDKFRPLGRRWEGFWANFGPKLNASSAVTGDQMWMEEVDQMGSPPRMWFDLTSGRPEEHWFSDQLKGTSVPAFKNAPADQVFTGHGRDIYGNFSIVGVVTPLPPQENIPGWHHVFMLKHYVNEATFVEVGDGEEAGAAISLSAAPDHELHQWRFSGVVLPGSKMMLGWWDMQRAPEDQPLSAGLVGPWIMWWAAEDPAWLAKTEMLRKVLEPEEEDEMVVDVTPPVVVLGNLVGYVDPDIDMNQMAYSSDVEVEEDFDGME